MLVAGAILLAVTLPAAAAPTPLGVAIATGGSATKHEQALTDEVMRSLEADVRFKPVPLSEEPGERPTQAQAEQALQAARDAFLILETDEAIARQKEGAELLLQLLFQGRDEVDPELRLRVLNAYAQHVGMLMQVGDKRAAAKVAATLGHLNASYRPEEVEFVTDAAAKLIAKEQKKHRRRRKGKLSVSAGRRGPPAFVRVDGEERGAAPLKLKLPPGDHVVTFHAPGAVSQSVLVQVRSRKTTKVKRTLVSSPASRRVAEAMSVLDLTRPGYQRVMGEVGPAFATPEVLFVTLREVGTALQLRATRVDMAEQIIRGSSKTTVDRRAKELDMALLFVLEEALLGERAGEGAAEPVAVGASGSAAAGESARSPAGETPAPASSTGATDEAAKEPPRVAAASGSPAEDAPSAPSATEGQQERTPSSSGPAAEGSSANAAPDSSADAPSTSSEAMEPGASEEQVAAVAPGAEGASGVSEAEEESGAGLIWGLAGAAGGAGALAVGVGVGAAVVTAVVLTQSAGGRPAGGTAAGAQRAGTTWTATGLVY